MKPFFLFILLSSSLAFAQDLKKIDSLVLTYPKYTKALQLAERISEDFQDDTSKVRAAFRWLTHQIRYDLEEFYQARKVIRFRYRDEAERVRKVQEIKDNIVNEAFLTKMGICEAYAQSFQKLMELLGIQAEVIKGYVRNSPEDIGRVPKTTNHAWNAVRLNNKWVILDATWAAGYIFNGRWIKDYNEYFFDIKPQKVNLTHYPEDRKWLIRWNYGSLEDFYNQPIYSHEILQKNISVLSPKKGVIVLHRNKSIVLKIMGLSTIDQVAYNFHGQRYAKRPIISRKGNAAILTIENPQRNTELVLFLNKKLAMEYKVSVR